MEASFMKLTKEEKSKLVERYQSGVSVSVLCTETGIPRSTLYTWIKQFSNPSKETEIPLSQDYNKLLSHLEKLESMIAVLQTVDCCTTSPLIDRLNVIEALHGQYSVHVLCEALKIPRGTYYNHIYRNKRDDTVYEEYRQTLRPIIQSIYDENRQVFGPGKIAVILREQGYSVSNRTVSSLMHEMQLSSISPKAKRDYAKWKKGENRNLLQQEFHADEPNQVWVSDFTVFRYKEKHYYICIILDLFSRKVIAHRVSNKGSTLLITKTFRSAYAARQPKAGLVFHSDRGSQYVSTAFQELLREREVTQSLSRSGQPCDNAVCESFFSYMKKEELYRRQYKSEKELLRGVAAYIDFYNSQRPHSSIKYKTPNRAEEESSLSL